MSIFIPISGLNDVFTISPPDFIPIVRSGSLTTYRVSITEFNNWLAQSGSILSASYATASTSASFGLSASYALLATSASYALNSLSASYALFASNAQSASATITASFANAALSSSTSLTASFANVSNTSATASYINFNVTSPSLVTASISSSWASSSLSASLAQTASFVATASAASSLIGGISGPGIAKAWATLVCTSSKPGGSTINAPGVDWNNLAVVNGHNVSSSVRTFGQVPTNGSGHTYPGPNTQFHWLVTLLNPLPSINYAVIGGGGEPANEYLNCTMFPTAPRTTTQFTLSLSAATVNFDDLTEITWINFMLFGL
jgi:hypothetical protein